MKGKGKKGKELEEKAGSPVNEFKKLDLSRECPKYLEILDRNIEEGIKLEELDALQLEIEALLVSVVYRKRQLQDDVERDKPNKVSHAEALTLKGVDSQRLCVEHSLEPVLGSNVM